jgi:hypothetical protein
VVISLHFDGANRGVSPASSRGIRGLGSHAHGGLGPQSIVDFAAATRLRRPAPSTSGRGWRPSVPPGRVWSRSQTRRGSQSIMERCRGTSP